MEREPGQLEGCWLQCARAGCRKWRLVAKDCLPALRGDGFGQAASARRVDERYACWRSWLDGSAERYADWVEAHGRAGNQNVVRFGAVGPESGNEAAVAAGGMGQGGWGVRPSAAEGAGRQEDAEAEAGATEVGEASEDEGSVTGGSSEGASEDEAVGDGVGRQLEEAKQALGGRGGFGAQDRARLAALEKAAMETAAVGTVAAAAGTEVVARWRRGRRQGRRRRRRWKRRRCRCNSNWQNQILGGDKRLLRLLSL